VFWKRIDIEPSQDDEERQARMFARWSTVFNAHQVEGFELTPDYEPSEIDTLAAADALVKASGADIRHGEARAYYRPSGDYINLPSPEAFKATSGSSATQNFYSTLFQLIAELGAAMLCATTGVETAVREDHAHYIASWLKALKSDKQFIFAAASQAQKVVDYLHSLQG
jgi:antirestriction protein ArdC